MRRIKNFYQNLKLRTKFVIAYILITLVPFTLFAAINSGITVSQTQKTAEAHTSQMIQQVSSSIDVYIGTIDKMASYITASVTQDKILEALEGEGNWQEVSSELQKILNFVLKSYPEIAGVLIATNSDDRYICTGMERISSDPFIKEEWYQLALKSPDKMILANSMTGRNIINKKDYSVDDVFSLAKAVVKPGTGEVLGVVLFDVSQKIIMESIGRITIGENGFVFVTDSENNIIYTPVNDVVYRVNPEWLDENNGMPITVNIAGNQYRIFCDNSKYTRWKTIGVFPMNEVMSSVNTIIFALVLSIIVTITIVIFMSFVVARSVTKPLFKLKQLMRQTESGNLLVRFNTQYNDEVGELGKSFNHMLDRIEFLINKVYEEQQSKRDAELKSLQEQIKPHFLYNTLDTISWMARDNGVEDIVRLVDALTNMFRIGLSKGKEIITVKEEITHISNYLYIQKIRYKSRLNYVIDVDETLLRYQVPKLILQPLVENAIYHGIKQKRGGGTISIKAQRQEDALIFTIEDDGAGMKPEQVENFNNRMNENLRVDENQGFGVFYVMERIRLHYGEGYGIKIDSVFGKGTCVTMKIGITDNLKTLKETDHV